jgi:ADP-glucose pyrophosphorylase
MFYKENSEENIIKLLMLMAHADSDFHENEKKIIKDKIKEFDLNPFLFDKYLNEVKTLENRSFKDTCLELIKLIKDSNHRNKTIKLLSGLVAEDFIIHHEEMMLLQLIADEWGMYQQKL